MEVGLLIIQAFVGLLLVGHGSQKLFGWFGGYGLEGTGGFMESLGMRPGKPMALAAGTSELVGGALLALGLLVPLAAMLIASTMLVAALTAHRGNGPWIADNGWELAATYAVVALGLAFNGAGRWSLDHAIGWDVAGLWWGIGAAALAVAGALGAVMLGRHRSETPAGAQPQAG